MPYPSLAINDSHAYKQKCDAGSKGFRPEQRDRLKYHQGVSPMGTSYSIVNCWEKTGFGVLFKTRSNNLIKISTSRRINFH